MRGQDVDHELVDRGASTGHTHEFEEHPQSEPERPSLDPSALPLAGLRHQVAPGHPNSRGHRLELLRLRRRALRLHHRVGRRKGLPPHLLPCLLRPVRRLLRQDYLHPRECCPGQVEAVDGHGRAAEPGQVGARLETPAGGLCRRNGAAGGAEISSGHFSIS